MFHSGVSYWPGRVWMRSWRSSSRWEPLRFMASVMWRNVVGVTPRLGPHSGGEGYGKAGVAHLADAAGCCGEHGGGLRGVPFQDAADRHHVLGREGVDGSAERRAQVVGADRAWRSC